MGTERGTDTGSAEEQGRRLAEEISTSHSRDAAREGKRKVDGAAEEKGRELAQDVPAGMGKQATPKP